jgi:hypothetical protein
MASHAQLVERHWKSLGFRVQLGSRKTNTCLHFPRPHHNVSPCPRPRKLEGGAVFPVATSYTLLR